MIKKGDTIKYKKEIMFKGEIEITAKVVMIHPVTNMVLLDIGAEMNLINNQLYLV